MRIRYLLAAGRLFTWLRVEAAATLLSARGESRLAKKLRIGYAGWITLNSGCYDFHLFFSSKNAQRLEAMLEEKEKGDHILVRNMHRVRFLGILGMVLRLFCFVTTAAMSQPLLSHMQVWRCGWQRYLNEGPVKPHLK